MKYFIIILFSIFPVFSLAVEGEPDLDLLKKAEAGDIDSIVQLYEFYEKKGDSDKANDYLNKAAEKGHIPSLKLVYQQTGKILSAGVEAAVSAHVFAPLKSSGGRTEFGLMRFNYMDHLSSRDGLEEETSHFRRSIISQITDGETNSLVETKTTGSSSSPKDGGGEELSKKVYDVVSLSPEANRALHEGRDIGYHAASSKDDRMLRGQPALMLVGSKDKGIFERFQAAFEQAQEEGKLGESFYIGEDILRGRQAPPVIFLPAEDGTFRPVKLKMGADGKYLHPPPKEEVVDERFQELYKRLKREGKLQNIGHLYSVSSILQMDRLDYLPMILGRYISYHLENSETRMEYWLSRLKSLANTGDMLALQMVYRITGEVLTEGYTKAVSNTIDSFFAEGREQGVSPKMTAMKNRNSVSESIMQQIKAPFVEGVEGLMFDLYEIHREKGNAEGVANWLNQFKKRANEGNVPALRMVYHITGEVLTLGLNTAVDSTMNSLFAEGREQGVSPKMTAMQNQKEVRNNILKQIKAPLGRCEGGF